MVNALNMSGVKSKLAASYWKPWNCERSSFNCGCSVGDHSTVPEEGKMFVVVKVTGTGSEGGCKSLGGECWTGRVAGWDVWRSIPRFSSFCVIRRSGYFITIIRFCKLDLSLDE